MKKVLLTLAFGVIGFAGFSQAQHTVTLNLQNVADIRFNSSITQTTSFTFDDGDKYDDGIEKTGAAGLQVRSNKNWAVSVKSDAANFSFANIGENTDEDPNMPASVLGVRKSGASSYSALSATAATLATGTKGGYGANEVGIDYKVTPGYTYPGGTYTLGVTYTVSNP